MDAQTCNVSSSSYAKSQVRAGIAHFGPGNFHRGHFAVIMDRYMDKTDDLNWGIVGITLRDPEKAERLRKQDFNYHVVERDLQECSIRKVRSILDIIHAPSDKKGVVELLASPDIKLITMTITQEGYRNPEGGFVPGDPTTVAGYIVQALKLRRERGVPPPTLMSCDNIPNNGTELKAAVLHMAQAYDPELAEWIGENVRFPDTMVDRIVPVPKREQIEWLHNQTGIDDPNALFTEPFRQLVIQKRFSGEFPEFTPAITPGVTVLEGMGEYELMKIRMLNGTHFAIGMIGTLAGYKYVDEAMRDPVLRTFVETFMTGARKSLKPIFGVNLEDTQKRYLARLDNPYMEDSLVRLPRNGMDKLRPRVTDTLRDLKARDLNIDAQIFTAAAWAHYIKGYDSRHQAFDILDPKTVNAGYQDLARKENVGAHLAVLRDVFGQDIAQMPEFVSKFKTYYTLIQRNGIRSAIETLLGDNVRLLAGPDDKPKPQNPTVT